jgi:hypothetical protein
MTFTPRCCWKKLSSWINDPIPPATEYILIRMESLGQEGRRGVRRHSEHPGSIRWMNNNANLGNTQPQLNI